MHKKFFGKGSAMLLAAAMTFNTALVTSPLVMAASETRFEFEKATITGDITVEKNANASGGSYLKMTESGTINIDFEVETGGMYDLTIYAGGLGSAKQQAFFINGVDQGSLSIPKNDTGFDAITFTVKLNKGKNALTIEKSWGWSAFDYFTVKPAELAPIKALDVTPCDINATAETRSLMNYLSEVYGKHIISGQQEIYSGGPHGLEYEFEYLKETTGHYPAIRGFDYGNFCCPCYGSNDGSTDRIIDWVKDKNGIATASFHLNVPTDFESYTIGSKLDWGKTTYTQHTDFSPSKAATEGTKENKYYIQSLEILAKEFKELEEQGIPVIWRPLHEAEGGGGESASWFWWGREGSEAYKKLWIYTYKTLTETYGCHNLIWEWNSYNFSTSANWYPGDEYVDIIGYDKYNCTDWSTDPPTLRHNDSSISSTFYGIMDKYDSAKMIAMAENDCFSTVENLTSEKAGWLYFCTWYDGGAADNNFLTNSAFNTKEDTIEMYQSDYCITLDELPTDLYKRNITPVDPSKTTTRSTKPTTTTTTTTTAPVPTGKDPSKITVDGNGVVNVKLPRPADTIYLNVDLPKDVTYANGCLGASVALGGKYYWVNMQWETTKSGIIKFKPADSIYNITLADDETDYSKDKEISAAVKEILAKTTDFQWQKWYAQNAAEEAVDTDNINLLGVYIDAEGSTVVTPPVNDGKGFYVVGQTIRDANGQEFEMRGVNIAHAWYKDKTEQSIKAAADLGSNCVRIVCSDGAKWDKTSASELEDIIEWCKENKQVCILEAHDATGSNNIADIVAAAEYWTEMKDILNANSRYVILNIANEWYGDWQSSTWADGCKQAIKVVRDAGIKNMIMIDCAGWGQYPTSIKEEGAAVFASDPDKNTVFSMHMYEYAGGTAEMVKNNIDGALNCGAPVLVGEFGYKHTDGDVDEETVMSYCKQKRMGYLAWSWKGNSGGVEYLDLANSWDGSKLSEWGEIYFNTIAGDSKIASVFTVNPSDIVWGDANCDGEVRLNDAVLVLQSIGNPDAYGIKGTDPSHITEKGMKNADVYENGSGLTSNDAIRIQQHILELIDNLDLPKPPATV